MDGDRPLLIYRATDAPAQLILRLVLEDGDGKLSKESPFQIFSFTTDRTAVETLGEAFSSDAFVVGMSLGGGFLGVKRGEFYCSVLIRRKGGTEEVVAEGYIYDGHKLSFGERVESGPGGGEGNLRSIDLGDPAAGADYADQTVPANALWKIRGFHGVFTTAVGGTDRSPSIRIQDGANVVVGGTRANVIQDPSEVATYLGAGNNYGHQYDQSVTGSVYNFVMPDFLIPEGFDVTFITQFIDASDNWGDGQLLVEEWIQV